MPGSGSCCGNSCQWSALISDPFSHFACLEPQTKHLPRRLFVAIGLGILYLGAMGVLVRWLTTIDVKTGC